MSDLLDRLKTALADRYAIEREIGAGGMATVYLADDLKHDRRVAVKVLRPELAATIGTKRFLREIRIAARLTHPHILPLHDSGEANGFLFYTMPFIEGESLRQRLIREQQLPVDEAIRLACEIAAALSYAHSAGFIHRDIKPENVLLHHGEAVVADFGIARAISQSGSTTLTKTGVALGTPNYMSPEQARGGADIDGRADTYSLGCLLYEMLGGQPPFVGGDIQEILGRHAVDDPVGVRNLRRAVPEYVECAIERALAKLPADRFETATQFAEALAGVEVAGTPGEVLGSETWHEARRRSTWWVRTMVGAGGIITLAALSWVLSTTSSGLTYVLVGPLRLAGPLLMNSSDSALSEQLGTWTVTDELNAMFASDSALRVIDSRTVSSALAEVSSDGSNQLSTEEWLRLAKRLGASHLVSFYVPSVGEGDSGITHTLGVFKIDVSNGDTLAAGSVVPIRGAVVRQTARVLRPRMGPLPEDITSIARSLDQDVRSHLLTGAFALLEGRYLEAVDGFQAVLNLDPDFGAAAILLLQAGSMAGNEGTSAVERGTRRAWELRDSLNMRDRSFVATFLGVGPDYPTPSTQSVYLAFADTVITSYLQEGRLATRIGDTAAAVWAYQRFLVLLTSPDLQGRYEVEDVRAELARMTAGPQSLR